MPWFKVDDRFHAHPKVLALRTGAYEAEALAVWAKAGSWCMANLTDGAVPSHVVETMLRKNAVKGADELVRVRLWERTEDGYTFRSWAEYQPSRGDVEAKRYAVTERVRAHRSRHREPEVKRDGNALHDDGGNAAVTPPPTRPDPTRTQESAAHSPGARDPGLGLMPEKVVTDDPSKRAVIAVLKVFEAAWGSPLGLLPDPNHTRVKSLLKAASERNPGNPLGAISEAARAACANENFRRTGSPFAAFCSQPWRHLTPETVPNAPAPKPLSPERQELAAAVEAVEKSRGTDGEYAAVERHRAAKRAVAMSERPVS